MKQRILSKILAALRPNKTIITIVVVVLLLGSSLGPGLMRFAYNVFSALTSKMTTVITPSPVIVEHLQALNRMETARQTTSQIVEAQTTHPFIPGLLGEDKLLMNVQVEVVAGIDMSSFSKEDVQMNRNTVIVKLPSPQIFSIRVDDENSNVYSRERGLLVFKPDADLEKQARLKAIEDARVAARKEVLDVARKNAEINIRSLLKSLGFENVEFKWADRFMNSPAA